MIEGWSVVALAIGYVSVLFAVAWYADRAVRTRKPGQDRPLIYALSLAVYCTSGRSSAASASPRRQVTTSCPSISGRSCSSVRLALSVALVR